MTQLGFIVIENAELKLSRNDILEKKIIRFWKKSCQAIIDLAQFHQSRSESNWDWVLLKF
jgi:hypothetical protein